MSLGSMVSDTLDYTPRNIPPVRGHVDADILPLSWWTAGGGGGTSQGGDYVLSGTIGQPEAGVRIEYKSAPSIRVISELSP